MNYTLFKIVGGKYDGRIVLENNETGYKIILATPTLKAKVGISMLSYDDTGKQIAISFLPTTIVEQYKLIPHLLKRLTPVFFQDMLMEQIRKRKEPFVLYGSVGTGKSGYIKA